MLAILPLSVLIMVLLLPSFISVICFVWLFYFTDSFFVFYYFYYVFITVCTYSCIDVLIYSAAQLQVLLINLLTYLLIRQPASVGVGMTWSNIVKWNMNIMFSVHDAMLFENASVILTNLTVKRRYWRWLQAAVCCISCDRVAWSRRSF